MTELKIIRKPIPRHDAWEKAFGLTKYGADFSMPGMLHAKVLRSPHASAKILSINTSRAERLKGVKAVLTAKDVPRNESVTRFGQTHTVGGGFEGLYRVLADKKVHYVGEAVALVAAETEEVVENTARVPFVDHASLEPESGVAWIDEDGVISIRVSTQVIEHFRGVAEVLNLPHNRVRVIAPYVGGGFGGKGDITGESFIALLP